MTKVGHQQQQQDFNELSGIVRQLSLDIYNDLDRYGLTGKSVTLKYKTEYLDVKTRAAKLAAWTKDPDVIREAALCLLSDELGQQTLLLLGLGMSQLLPITPGKQQRT